MKSLIASLLLVGSSAYASGGGGHHEDGIPMVVLYQAINFSIFVGILAYFAKDKVKALFQGRYDDFTRLARETEQTRKNLEFKIADIIRRTNTLEQTSQKSLSDAQRDAEKLYNTMIEDAKQAAARLQNEVTNQIKDDQAKMLEKLRTEALEMSVASAKQQLETTSQDEKVKVTRQFSQRVEGAAT